MEHRHFAIYMHQNQVLKVAMDAMEEANIFLFSQWKGEVFSNEVLKKFIKEEYQHDSIVVNSSSNSSLSTMSSGQQTKALLLHLLSKKIDYIILDDVFSYLDQENILEIKEIIYQYSPAISFIQLAYRKDDILDWIEDRYILKDNKTNLQKLESTIPLLSSSKNINLDKVFSFQAIPELAENKVVIEFKNVNVSYHENKVFENFSWVVHQGEFWQIIGPNGSGKSTLLSMIYGDNVKAFGQNVSLFGRRKGSGESVWEIKQKIGFFSAATTMLHPRNDTVKEMIIGGMHDTIGLYQNPSLSEKNKSMAWIESLDLLEVKDKPFKNQTTGIQRIVMIARAMIKEPSLLILDEPMAGLDDENTLLLVDLICKISRTKKTTILYVSHRKESGLIADKYLHLGLDKK